MSELKNFLWLLCVLPTTTIVGFAINRASPHNNCFDNYLLQHQGSFRQRRLNRACCQELTIVSLAAKGFGAARTSTKKTGKKNHNTSTSPRNRPTPSTSPSQTQEQLLDQLASSSSQSPIGQAVEEAHRIVKDDIDPFWELMPSLIQSKFPNTPPTELQRLAGFVKFMITKQLPTDDTDLLDNLMRPADEMHAYMPDMPPTKPFHDPAKFALCQALSENYDTILQEYQTLLAHNLTDRFQSVTSMNYDAGWQTLVLFYNSHRIPDFPYHLCPVTTRILESVPLAGRIAGFNRQQPKTGIPVHSDGNNMWLTCQMGLSVPDDSAASIRVGQETRHWQQGECLLYDTTYEHETFNRHDTQERVVVHVDFFNTAALTAVEIAILQYIYQLREQFLQAEGVAKVGAQIL